jgi:hypothetical protein
MDDNTVGIGSTETKTTAIKTSQNLFSLTEGKSGGSVSNVFGSEMAPNGISTKECMTYENQLKTTQQILGELSLNEGNAK